MTFLKQLVVLSAILLGLNLDAMEKESILHFHLEASRETYHNISHHDYCNQSDSNITVISGEFDISNWGERSNNAPQESIDTEWQHQQDSNEYSCRESMAQDHVTQQQDKYSNVVSHERLTQTKETSQQRDSFYKPHVNYIRAITNNLLSHEYRDNLIQARALLEKALNKHTFGNTELKKQIKFIDALLDGSINRLLVTIQKDDLKTAKKAFAELKKAWPWEEPSFSYLVAGYSLEESKFIKFIETDIIQVARNTLVLRKDYLESNNVSVSQIETYQNKIRNIQLQGDRKNLIAEREGLIEAYQKERYADFKLAIEVKIVTLNTILYNPTTQIFSTIKNANLDKASEALDGFKTLLLLHFKEHGFTTMNEARADMIKREGVDLLAAANKCFESRSDLKEKIAQQKSDGLQDVQSVSQSTASNNEQVTNINSFDMVSTTAYNHDFTISTESNQSITASLATLSDQGLETIPEQIDALNKILQEKKVSLGYQEKFFVAGLKSHILLQKYTENPNKRIVKQPTINAYIFNTRKDALASVTNNPTECSEQFYTLNPNICTTLKLYGINPTQYTYCLGNAAQQQFHTEVVTMLNEMAHISLNAYTQPLFDMVITCTHLGNVYTQQNNLETAFNLADCSWAALDCAKAINNNEMNIAQQAYTDIANGIMRGLKSAVQNNVDMVLHPVETLSNVAGAFCHLTYCFGKLIEPIMLCDGETYVDLETITRANEEWQANAQSIINAAKEITVEGSAAFITDFIVSPQITKFGFGVLSHYSKTPVAQLVKVTKEAKDKLVDKAPKFVSDLRQKVVDQVGNLTKAEDVAVTANGVKVTVTNTPQGSQRSMDKMGNAGKDTIKNTKPGIKETSTVLRVNKMEEFFETDFGKLLKSKSRKTHGIFHGKTVYAIVEKINGTELKKGYLYYLDALHLDHIEVFDARGHFVGAYSLNGTWIDAGKKAGRRI